MVVDGLTYPVIVSDDGPGEACGLVARAGRRAFVVSDRNVVTRGELIAAALRRAGCKVLGSLALDAGERHKRWKSVAAVHAALLAAEVDRATVVVAVGGGTLTDVAGFAAATFLRGVAWLPVATTVLGMVDAAIGGKTGVDLPEGKNLIGSLWQPIGVVADLEALTTLPLPQRATGMAEIVKAAIIGGPSLLALIERHDIESEPLAWAGLVAQSAGVKAQVVAADPGDRGARAALNLGHTFAHAIEQASRYRVAHGTAVALGLRAAGVLARDRTGWSQFEHQRVLAALRRSGLKLRSRRLPIDDIVAAMRLDKKRHNGVRKFVLPVRLGEVRTGVEIGESDVRETLATLGQSPRRGAW